MNQRAKYPTKRSFFSVKIIVQTQTHRQTDCIDRSIWTTKVVANNSVGSETEFDAIVDFRLFVLKMIGVGGRSSTTR